jgi:hypothetical protein
MSEGQRDGEREPFGLKKELGNCSISRQSGTYHMLELLFEGSGLVLGEGG